VKPDFLAHIRCRRSAVLLQLYLHEVDPFEWCIAPDGELPPLVIVADPHSICDTVIHIKLPTSAGEKRASLESQLHRKM
jgi:hypothetical protein